MLDKSLHIAMTSAVLNQTQIDSDGSIYFDDFVGDGDLDAENNTVVRCNDKCMYISYNSKEKFNMNKIQCGPNYVI